MPSLTTVSVRRADVCFPTYRPLPADKNPMFLEKRVYQGSNGKVYPLPFTDRIAQERVEQSWDAVHLENRYIRVMILPQLGGRIHVGYDKTNDYDFFYRQNVIKPALVGLAGPWISGGVEFNWPQHHRPSTFMPADVHIEDHADGSKTVWLSEHDPMNRMKGMHGVCLHPDRNYIELKARIYNRTPSVQTFLWWANVATRVHAQYQSFFPPDATYVADHAKRAMSEFPYCADHYYGVDYASRARQASTQGDAHSEASAARADDLSWYANIPVPTSYMCMGTDEDFFGGYDHAREAGVVHIANHHISPGKKQWTWGNHDFGYAWDRNLTDSDGPYIELMAGVYTDNQPDFSFLMPGESRTWSQYWYPIQKIGPAQHANLAAAVNLTRTQNSLRIGVSVSSAHAQAVIQLFHKDRSLQRWTCSISPGESFVESCTVSAQYLTTDFRLKVTDFSGEMIIEYQPEVTPEKPVPPAATEPALPKAIASIDELYLTGLHLEQYRHATRYPEVYWLEAIRRDSGDSRCNNALGRWHFRRGEFALAEPYFRAAIARQTLRNPNPYDGEPFYNLGLCLRYLDRDIEAYAAFYKATWNHAWQAAAFHALAELDCLRNEWATALEHIDRALRVNTDNLRARNLRALVLAQLGRSAESEDQLRATRVLDSLDWQSRYLLGEPLACDTQLRLDLALDFARAGFFQHALDVLTPAVPETGSGTAPLLSYYRAWLLARLECSTLPHSRSQTRRVGPAVRTHLKAAAVASSDYCFPARLEEIAILRFAIAKNPSDSRALYYLGNLFYDRRRHREAIAVWEQSVVLDNTFSIVWRNLGIAYFNIAKKPAKARAAYERAFAANPADARLLYERDQLWKRMGVKPSHRLRTLEKYPELIRQRDDLSVELCALYNLTGQSAKALAIVSSRHFQPWEGGEGLALGQYVRTHLTLGRNALQSGSPATALQHFQHALRAPENLGEAKHPLANQSDIHFWLGEAYAAAGDRVSARKHWSFAASSKGDFQSMSVVSFSEMTYFSALALARLGRSVASKKTFHALLRYGRRLAKAPAQIDYFATSLPTMLLFDEDLSAAQRITADFLCAQAMVGLRQTALAKRLLASLLQRDPSHAAAAELLTHF